MSSGNADGYEAVVVAPQERSPQLSQYLAMAGPTYRSIDTGEQIVDQLLQLAQRRTGMVSFSADSSLHFEGLRCLAESIQRDSYYDEIGRRAATAYIHNWIIKYIKFEQDLVAFPEISRVPVPNPMFLIGFGRTGSTFLHKLMSLDAQARAPQRWELTEPSPPPRPESYDTDRRIRQVQKYLKSMSIAFPDLNKIHEMDAQAPDECHLMMWHGPHHIIFGLRSAEYAQWLRNLSLPQLQVLYKFYRSQVQHLQLFHRGGHWLSKSLAHAYFFPVLFKVFPDARIVRLHRDPCQVIPALASLSAHLQVSYTSRIDFRELGQRMLDLFLDFVHRSMQVDKEVSSEHFIDVLFDELTRDPIAVIRRIYAKFGYDYADKFDEELRSYLQRESVTRKYKHVYSLEQFGLSRAQVMAKSEEYLTWVTRRTGSILCRF
jgi:sulfotransferase family protein